ncbi:MAG: glutamate synthase [Terriglobia bacterium]
MCRLSAITANQYFSPMENIEALDTMKEGHDGSGLGLMLKNLGGAFKDLKAYPILSGILTSEGLETLEHYMREHGFEPKFVWQPKIRPVSSIRRRDHYMAIAYDYPAAYADKPTAEKEQLLTDTRVALRRMGEPDGSMFIFSFYPDVLTLKEIGSPLEVAEFFGLDTTSEIQAKIILAQGRQNTNYDIYLYACHPFFIQGYGTMTNGENTAFVPIREFLMSRGNAAYMGYNSDSEVFAHILHYANRTLKFPLTYYKDVITPLTLREIDNRTDREALRLIRNALRPLCIDGPNAVIGFTPDGTLFMVQDAKKLRPGVVGGGPGKYAMMSEECGLERAIPDRDKSADVYPMKYDMAIVTPEAGELRVWSQLQGSTKVMN